MRVLVPVLELDSVAHRALEAEGIAHEEYVCEGDVGYSELVVDLWADGQGFILVEHDVAPWGGALAELWDCPADWCMFRYFKYGGGLTRGLGCAKFSDRLVSGHPDLSITWRNTSWRILDGTVGAAVALTLRGEDPDRHPLCIHGPPVAHVRRPGD